MVGVWETEDESTVPVGSLPTPADTPYRIPSRNVSRGSRKSKRSVTPPGKNGKSRSPAPLNGERNDRASMMSAREFCSDEPVSIDSKRFTPTLHANLVSEILSLRRDQEDKLKIIESLESSLEAVRGESESLQARVVSTDKESRSLKRQLALLEGGTSSALGELARERDEAVDSVAETKKRLDITQKKLRSQEEDSERVHRQWEKEKNEWEEEKRKLERKIHVAESRLKVVIDEVTAFQPVQVHGENGLLHDHESEGEESVKDNDAASVRTMSLTSTARFSIASPKANGMSSLADELDGFDEESDYGGRESVMSNGPHHAHFRNMSRDSIMSKSHRRRQSNDSLMRSGSVARSRLVFSPTALERLEGSTIQEDDETESITPKAVYVDTGVQPSPPPSPKVAAVTPATPEPSKFMQRYERLYGDLDSPPRADLEIEANQRRKRVQIGQPLAIKTSANNLMVNGSSQTQEEPLSPPKTPKTPFQELPPTPKPQIPAMVSSSTQTEDIAQPLQLPVLSIPSISIIPPSSRPSTPRQPLLPQLTKDFGCQVSLISSPPTSSSSMQTEEIRVDKRLAKLPPHLQPSAITSRPVSPALPTPDLPTDDFRQFTPVPGNVPPPRNPRRLTSKRSIVDIPSSPPVVSSPATEEARDAYPGNNDDGPVSNQTAAIRRPHRISSLFAGFDGNSTDEGDEFMDLDISDSEYRTALSAPSAPRTVESSSRMGKRGSETTAASSDSAFSPKVSSRYSPRLMDEPDGYGGYGSANIISQTRETRDTGINSSGSRRGGPRPAFGTKASVMRRAALIQSGINSHSRARSPSLTDTKEPPFPIPTRASSRKPPLSGSAPSEGRSPSRGSDAWHRRGSSRSHYRAGSIRKVRSATGLPRGQRRQPSRSPSRFAESVEAPESPSLPPLPTNDITTPRNKESTSYAKYRSHRSQPSTANTATTGETGGASQAEPKEKAFTVVEAIAQTMVGEWMYKYVRRRKSFGMSDAKGGDDTSNDRHKRWVWLQPYDRCILWSSKQPTTGGALLGKSGRKLTIQSVIDVKDDNPPPRGAGQLFNRSILILTPQRALKFTASSAERHYIWLNSLSFLAHSNQAIPESLPVPQAQPKPSPEQYELPKAKVRRPIRDSIRLTKARTGAPVIKSDPMEPPQLEIDSAPPAIGGYRPPMPDIYSIPSHTREESTDTAAPPPITRYGERGVHGRKRSNTGGHVPPPLSFRGFSGPIGGAGYHASTNSTAGNSIAGSSDVYSNAGASAVTGASSAAITWGTGSVRTSEASNRPNGPNFFDAIGTVRMEAFISPLAFSRFGDTPYEDSNERDDDYRRAARRRSKELRRRASRSRQRDSYHSRGTRATTEEVDEWYSKDTRDDPFRGF